MRALLILLLYGCSSEPLLEEDRVDFEGNWWQTGCPLFGCPICFYLEEDGELLYFSVDDPTEVGSEEWWFKPPNFYSLDYGNLVYNVQVTRNGDCFDLQLGPIKEKACKCSVSPEEE